ncbi:alanine racemase [Anaerosphaera aminiphila DSM 21120]|uniref:Alanine racemase n=1 Tax=Anaerosphaera aminiphila DSM 21120 TaxID=1120995 RepID=A0A1M5RGM0_9FIRM|nr:alanine racemase [Anaerosphaera aminiphila]SHH25404.1 alanine racemase [Anaerosphaera aminiphila DSM 21120]
MKLTRSAWMEVNLDKLENNMSQIKNIVDDNIKIISVVKSNAYSFGVTKIVETLRKTGVNYFAVATNSEALKIRKNFNDVDILVLGHTPDFLMEDAIDNNIVMAVYDLESALKLNEMANSKNKVARIHLAIDSGMNRIGFKLKEKSYSDVEKISKLENVKIEGAFSHFAAADTDIEYTKNQFANYKTFVEEVEKRGVDVGLKHINNSQGIINYKESSLDAVRPGIVQYGSTEGVESKYEGFSVDYIGEIKARITNLKVIEKGEKVSYGLTYEADKTTEVATIPLGYSDGLLRQLSNKIDVLVNGNRCPQIGRICMDQMMIDVTGMNCKIGDEVVVLGKQGNEEITILEIAEKAGEIATSYSCHFSMRLPRVYIRDGKVESIYDINLE